MSGEAMSGEQLRQTARRVARALAADEAYDPLDRAGFECGYGDGGCRIPAMALQRVLGGELYAVYRDDGIMDHVVLRLGSRHLDVDGLHTERRLLGNRRMAMAGRSGVTIGRFQDDKADDSGIPYDESTTAALAEYLRGRLTEGEGSDGWRRTR